MKLIYVFDAYCGWSYGFSPTLVELTAQHPEFQVEVISGGLFTGPRRPRMSDLAFLRGANAKITEMTGVAFGPGFDRLLAEGSFVMDSEVAARGVAALRQAAPDRIVELVVALQEAFYRDGLSLSEPATYRTIAERAGLDGDEVATAFIAPQTADAARRDFATASALGVRGFPTLLAAVGDQTTELAVGHATTQQIERRLGTLAGAH